MTLKLSILAVALFTGVSLTHAQERIDTDRPDQTESPVTTPVKLLQFEMGLNLQQNNATEKEYFLPTLLSKYGISKRFELRLITTVQTYAVAKMPTGITYKTGLQPVELGTKIALTEEKKLLPKTSLLLHLGIPTLASKDLRAHHLAPRFRFSMQHTLSPMVGLGYNLGAEWDGFSKVPAWVYTLAPGFNLGKKWYAYIEAFGEVSSEAAAQHNIDGGFAWFPNNDMKIDVSSGFGISKASPQWYIALGFSARFKTGK